MVGVVLFRAQPFHRGHLSTIQVAARECEEVYVFIGSANKCGTSRNPLPIHVRMDLVTNAVKDLTNVKVVALEDLSDEADNSLDWGMYLHRNIHQTTGSVKFTMYYCDNPQIMLSWFDTSFLRECITFKFLHRFDGISATKIRKAIKEKDELYLYKNLPTYVYESLDKIRPYFL